MSMLSLVPSSRLSVPTDNTKRPNRFIRFSESWLHLQDDLQSSLQLPITKPDFEKACGTATGSRRSSARRSQFRGCRRRGDCRM
jgi:hypothetical protein